MISPIFLPETTETIRLDRMLNISDAYYEKHEEDIVHHSLQVIFESILRCRSFPKPIGMRKNS